MNSYYFDEYIDLLERVLSFAHQNLYSFGYVESRIVNNDFFKSLEKSDEGYSPIITDNELIKELFPDSKMNLEDVPLYNQCLWAAESYLKIQEETSLTFEAIFLYIPLDEMYNYFPIYHEMDFSQIVSRFKELYLLDSVLQKLIDRSGFTICDISNKTNINKDTLYSLKDRRRDIKNASVLLVSTLANLFKVRVETIAELKQ